MNHRIHVQRATIGEDLPADRDFRCWAAAALSDCVAPVEISIRIVGERESAELNQRYRGKKGPTNVLSFGADLPPALADRLGADEVPLPLGDLVICAPVVLRESQAQSKHSEDHWAHMVIHGVLHLLGHDHQTDDQAAEMEALEVRVLRSLGVGNPYA